jgi:hypothetical protein
MSINITVALQRIAVSVTAGDHVTLQTPAKDTVDYGGGSHVKFTLAEGYNPVVKIGSVDTALTADASGVYTVTVSNVTAAVTVSVSAVIQTFDVTLTRGENVSLKNIAAGTTSVNYGSNFPFSFEVLEDNYVPVVTVDGKKVDVGAPVGDVYSYTVTNITAATVINVTAVSAGQAGQKFTVTLTKDDHVTLGNGVAASAEVIYGDGFAFSFTVATGYLPVLKVNDVEVTDLAAPNVEGVYSYTVANITATTTIQISAKLDESKVDVTLLKGANVTLGAGITEGARKVSLGSDFPFSFTVTDGYEPEVMVNNVVVPLVPDANGVYSYTVLNITVTTGITITASSVGDGHKKFNVLLSTDANVTLGNGVATSAEVDSAGSFPFSFTVADGFLPVVKVNSVEVSLVPDANGVYSYTVLNITATTTISITAKRKEFGVTLEKGANVGTITPTAGTHSVTSGEDFTFSFRLKDGYLPVLKVNNVEVTDLAAPDATGLYSYTVRNITAATTIAVSGRLDESGNDNGNGPTGVETLAADAPRFYPNPASDVLTFANTEKASIYTVSGTLVGVYTEATISIAHLPAGIYVVKMQRGDHTRTARLVKN